MFKNKALLVVILLGAVGGFGLWQYSSRPESQDQQEQTVPESKTYEILYMDAGYSPSPVTIKIGDTVKFVNNSTHTFWPASAIHPTHTVYPGSNITKCNTSEANAMFDACKPLEPGVVWSFTFTEKGKWNYHDHLNPQKYGSIVVE